MQQHVESPAARGANGWNIGRDALSVPAAQVSGGYGVLSATEVKAFRLP
jgi:hypothetical protein